MIVYRRKPVIVEVFAFGVQPQPQWFVDATYMGENHIEGNGTFASYRLKESKRILKICDGDMVIKYGSNIWVCERESFGNLYELAVPEEDRPQTQASMAVAAMVVGAMGICIAMALGSWFGAGVGWMAMAAIIFLMMFIGLFRSTGEVEE